MKSRRASLLNPAELAQEKQLAADKAAGLSPDDFAEGENVFPNIIDWKEVIGKNGQKKRIAQCPACAAEGFDKHGTHLVVFPAGKFGCIRFEAAKVEGPARTDHLAKIWKMAGGKSSGLVKPVPMDPAIKERRVKMAADVKAKWAVAREKYMMTMEDWQAMSADLPGSPEGDFKYTASHYKPGQFGWFGQRYENHEAFQKHLWEVSKDWAKAFEHVQYHGLDHTFGYTFAPGSTSRAKENRAGKVFDVVEHDEDGIEGQIALTRYLQASGMRLLQCVGTGNRGFHSWFDAGSITPERREMILFFLETIGADKSAFQRASSRTPGAVRQDQGDGKPHGMHQPIIFIPKI